ncbi:type III sulfide quinone reductase, selenoprotein subtype [Mycobacterium helveticum]|uniref:NAD(P)/FAD-dependent oxidoreductase n=1 Tax=Mycobacterium helveticum TaxID=2592811 RepID=A0A557XKP4_9MYCO|nr:FAD/NAD(P)-binding oxidoreductase [Mycobacterium helveticum]TVS85617.1 NAD(P)/FAD-dependent oxidoreductase [Mycobacterium helveticum]TVS86336.1 NAD(P)/FAD-dependent oxidoreductase [Mycobacterium helveticum]
MNTRIVILGAGTGGTLIANRLRRKLSDADITIVDRDDAHVYQPGLLFVPFGLIRPEEIVKSRKRQLRSGIHYVQSDIDRVDVDGDRVHLTDGTVLDYDVLVIATGSRLLPEETEGMTGPGWMRNIFPFYNLEGASALQPAMSAFDHGRLAVSIVDMPIKCPVAPLEFCFLADWYFRRRGIRDRVELVYVTPLDGAFTKPVAARELGSLLQRKGIELVTEFNIGQVDGDAGRLISYDERTVPFDLAVVIPLQGGADFVGRSPGLGDELNFVLTDQRTLQSTVRPNIFAIGDATNVPTSKAGSVTHFEGDVLTHNIVQFLAGRPLDEHFDGHANCFIESGDRKALLIDFDYDTQPLPGHFPLGVGLPLLRESRLNHLGKLAFRWLYWNVLLPGRDIPGIASRMPRAGKRFETVSR